jgi:subtilisin family serine protease
LLNDPVAEYGYTESSANGSLVIVNLSSSLLSKVIENQDLLIINQKGTPQLTNAEASQIISINDLADQNQIAGLKGKGEIIGVADTGLSTGNFATIHPAFTNPTYLDKIAAVFPSSGWGDPHGHGTHVAGSVLGSGLGATVPADGTRYKGMAPEAKLVFQAIFYTSYGNNPIYSIIQDAYNAGARIHSNSWSNSYDWGQYDTYTRFFDQYMWDNMDFQLLFAAGNDRQAPQYYPWPPSNNGTQCLTAFSGSKNCIAVGASQNNKTGYTPNRMAVFSSIGPTHDGRIKPDVIAPGNYVRSSWRGGGYANMSGTSMATPITAGSLALIRENYRKTYHLPPSEIPASLLKATMINGCNTTDVYDHTNYAGGAQLFLSRSNFISGFGRVDIKNSIFPSSINWMFYNEYASDRSKGLKPR